MPVTQARKTFVFIIVLILTTTLILLQSQGSSAAPAVQEDNRVGRANSLGPNNGSITIVKDADPPDGSDFAFSTNAVPTSKFLLKWDGKFGYIAVDGSGNVYVTDNDNLRIQKFDADGIFLLQWGSSGSGGGQFGYLSGVAADKDGNIYVADGNSLIKKFDANGNFILEWGEFGFGDDTLSGIQTVAVDMEGNVYVGDSADLEVLQYDRVQKYDANGNYLTTIETGFRPHEIAVDAAGQIYVATGGDLIQKFDANGNYLLQWGSQGSGDGQFTFVTGIALDAAGHVYISDYSSRIQVFDGNGTFLYKWGSQGSGDGQFEIPSGLAANKAGYIFVNDANNERIQKFGINIFGLDDAVRDDGDQIGDRHTFHDLAPGSYSFTEMLPEDWSLKTLSCSGGSFQADLPTQTVTVNLSGNEAVTCAFGNAYSSTTKPFQNIYLPGQEVVPGSDWQAGIQVQNSGTFKAIIGFAGVAANGAQTECGYVQTPPGDSANFLTLWGCPSGHPTFSAGVVRLNQPGAAIASIGNAPAGVAGGQYRGMNAAQASPEIFFPLVKHDHNGRTTSFSVQNTGGQSAQITAVFKVNGQTFTKTYQSVPAQASVLITPADAGVPGGVGQVGSLSVNGSQPLAGASLEHEHDVAVAQNLQTSSAFSPADKDTKLYCPLYRNDHAAKKQTSGVQVQNVSDQVQTITLDYTPVGNGAKVTKSEVVQPGASATFYAPSVGVPAGSLGSVTVSSTGEIVAVTNEGGKLDDGRRIMTTYTCFPASSATKRVLIPLYKEFYKGNSSGIQVQNVAGDGSTATIQMAYTATNSSAQAVFTHSTPIPDGGSITFWGVSTLSSPPGITAVSGSPAALAGTYGSVVITSDKPIVAIANETTYLTDGSGQDSKNYEGFNE